MLQAVWVKAHYPDAALAFIQHGILFRINYVTPDDEKFRRLAIQVEMELLSM